MMSLDTGRNVTCIPKALNKTMNLYAVCVVTTVACADCCVLLGADCMLEVWVKSRVKGGLVGRLWDVRGWFANKLVLLFDSVHLASLDKPAQQLVLFYNARPWNHCFSSLMNLKFPGILSINWNICVEIPIFLRIRIRIIITIFEFIVSLYIEEF